MTEIAPDRKYTKTHEWVRVEGGNARLGLSDYAQEHLTDIVYVELPDTGDEATAGEALCVVESVKAAEDFYSPVSGEIIEVNDELEDSPELINESPYEKGWLVLIALSDESELDGLMDVDAYRKYMDEM